MRKLFFLGTTLIFQYEQAYSGFIDRLFEYDEMTILKGLALDQLTDDFLNLLFDVDERSDLTKH